MKERDFGSKSHHIDGNPQHSLTSRIAQMAGPHVLFHYIISRPDLDHATRGGLHESEEAAQQELEKIIREEETQNPLLNFADAWRNKSRIIHLGVGQRYADWGDGNLSKPLRIHGKNDGTHR